MKHFTEKIISKLVVENNQVIQDPKAILTEQKLFYEYYVIFQIFPVIFSA
jgi:hypothetical protein